MTLLEALKLISTITLEPMSQSQKSGYDTATENPLYGESDGVVVIVDGDVLQLEVTNETGGEEVYTIEMTPEGI